MPTSRLTRITAVALATAALGAPAANARPASEPGRQPARPGLATVIRSSTGASTPAPPRSARAAPPASCC